MSTIQLSSIRSRMSRLLAVTTWDVVRDVGGHRFTFRPLTGSQRTEVNSLLAPMAGDDIASQVERFSEHARKTLAYGIVQIDDLDLRGIEFVETEDGDVTKALAISMLLDELEPSVFNHLWDVWTEVSVYYEGRIKSHLGIKDEDLSKSEPEVPSTSTSVSPTASPVEIRAEVDHPPLFVEPSPVRRSLVPESVPPPGPAPVAPREEIRSSFGIEPEDLQAEAARQAVYRMPTTTMSPRDAKVPPHLRRERK